MEFIIYIQAKRLSSLVQSSAITLHETFNILSSELAMFHCSLEWHNLSVRAGSPSFWFQIEGDWLVFISANQESAACMQNLSLCFHFRLFACETVCVCKRVHACCQYFSVCVVQWVCVCECDWSISSATEGILVNSVHVPLCCSLSLFLSLSFLFLGLSLQALFACCHPIIFPAGVSHDT